jgi:hypothetical protein
MTKISQVRNFIILHLRIFDISKEKKTYIKRLNDYFKILIILFVFFYNKVAELPELIIPALTQPELDFAGGDFKPFNPESTAGLLEKFDRNIEAAASLLEKQPDDRMGEPWRLRSGDHVLFELPRSLVVRFVGLNHVIHHRGQLSVYLRLLDVPLPSIYGPSADEAGA